MPRSPKKHRCLGGLTFEDWLDSERRRDDDESGRRARAKERQAVRRARRSTMQSNGVTPPMYPKP